ncbi:MAG: flagellar hook-basal body complex protein FliE [Halothiobacillaceae bacterium]|nr:MAG: flagellar hook-basal body complex protein FliE [Halothiobacillaceae bacterium]
MSDMNINAVLNQMRAVRSQAAENLRVQAQEAQQPGGGDDFATLMRRAIDGVSSVQRESRDLATRFETGDRDVDLTQVMIADQKASLAFTAVTQVRNKLVTAYQDIMNMPV